MNTNKYVLLLAAAVLTGFFCAVSAFASVAPGSQADYQGLRSVPMHAAKLPQLEHGLSKLTANEGKYRENLPMQLSQPMAKVKKAKYKPSKS